MRNSFGVDDTLRCDPAVPSDQFVRWWKRWRYDEAIRSGMQAT